MNGLRDRSAMVFILSINRTTPRLRDGGKTGNLEDNDASAMGWYVRPAHPWADERMQHMQGMKKCGFC
jgi:hypothetical protein